VATTRLPMIAPYPFERLPRVSRMQAAALGELRLALSTLAREPLANTASALFGGAEVSASLGVVDVWPREDIEARLSAPGLVAQLSHGAAGAHETVLLDLSTQTASYLAGRVLGSDASLADAQAGVPLGDFEQGVFAYALARLLSASECGFALHRMHRNAADAVRALGSSSASVAVCPVEVRTGERSSWLRVLWPSTMRAPRTPRTSQALLSWVTKLPTTMTLRAGQATLSFAEIAGLQRDDVVLPDRSELSKAPSGLAGRVRGCITGSPWALAWQVDEPRRLTLIERVIDNARANTWGTIVSRSEHDAKHDAKHDAASADERLARELPVALDLVVGKVTLSVAELSSLRPGDVLTTRAPLGQHITLESAGRSVAEGELVDVDGELGVRILRVLGH
jgi:type III secretion protein Q